MTDIAKLKQEAEDARKAAIKEIRYTHTSDFYDPSAIADSLIAATIAQIALQAAEKEAEAQAEKYPASEGWLDWSGNVQPVGDYDAVDTINVLGERYMGAAMRFYWGGDDVPERIVRWRNMSKASALSTDPAPIADDDVWLDIDISGCASINANNYKQTPMTRPIADDGWIKWEGGECPVDKTEYVAVKFKDGRISSTCYRASYFLWQHDGANNDIIAYRIIQPAADRIEE